MSRSIWKGKFINPKLLREFFLLSRNKDYTKIKKNFKILIWSRDSIILPFFLGFHVSVHNGKRFFSFVVDEYMIGHRFGEFAYTKKMGINIHLSKINRVKTKKTGIKKK
jgi:small subunit ribosomal protein S19